MERERIRGENEWAEMFTPAPSVQMVQIPLAQLVPWEQADGSPQPFKPYTQEKLAELADSIRQHGVLEAIRVRPGSRLSAVRANWTNSTWQQPESCWQDWRVNHV